MAAGVNEVNKQIVLTGRVVSHQFDVYPVFIRQGIAVQTEGGSLVKKFAHTQWALHVNDGVDLGVLVACVGIQGQAEACKITVAVIIAVKQCSDIGYPGFIVGPDWMVPWFNRSRRVR